MGSYRVTRSRPRPRLSLSSKTTTSIRYPEWSTTETVAATTIRIRNHHLRRKRSNSANQIIWTRPKTTKTPTKSQLTSQSWNLPSWISLQRFSLTRRERSSLSRSASSSSTPTLRFTFAATSSWPKAFCVTSSPPVCERAETLLT